MAKRRNREWASRRHAQLLTADRGDAIPPCPSERRFARSPLGCNLIAWNGVSFYRHKVVY
jgi:hypothetical protein